MAYEPEMILLDEPFSALDMYLKDQLQRELAEMLADYEGTVIMVSHNRDEVYRFSEELLIIDQGKIAASGETKAIFRNPVSREAARLTGCKNFSKAHRIDVHTVVAEDWESRSLQRGDTRSIQSMWDTVHMTLSRYGARFCVSWG